MNITFSGSISESPAGSPSLGSYRSAVYGSVSVASTSRTPLAALYNASTGSVNLRMRSVRVSVSPKGETSPNDVCFLLGSKASGSVAGTAFSPATLDPSYPPSVAVPYGATITGPTIDDPMNGWLVPAQAQSLVSSPTPPIVIADVNAQSLDDAELVVAPGRSYVVSLSQLDYLGGATVFAYVAEFGWDEEA